MLIKLYDDVGTNIRNIRKCRCLSQRNLAYLARINEATIKKYEMGIRIPKDENLKKIGYALGVDFWILKGYKAKRITEIELISDLDYLM